MFLDLMDRVQRNSDSGGAYIELLSGYAIPTEWEFLHVSYALTRVYNPFPKISYIYKTRANDEIQKRNLRN